tara:strand:+ start:545 stop:928 length:384 start_codon:yes stop_codon:yes gene_type:complete
MSDEHISYLKSSTALVSDSLSDILSNNKVDEQATLPSQNSNFLKITGPDTNISSALVRKFSISEDTLRVSFLIGPHKLLETQAFYSSDCNISYGTFSFFNFLCDEWECAYIDQQQFIVSLCFIKQRD